MNESPSFDLTALISAYERNFCGLRENQIKVITVYKPHILVSCRLVDSYQIRYCCIVVVGKTCWGSEVLDLQTSRFKIEKNIMNFRVLQISEYQLLLQQFYERILSFRPDSDRRFNKSCKLGVRIFSCSYVQIENVLETEISYGRRFLVSRTKFS